MAPRISKNIKDGWSQFVISSELQNIRISLKLLQKRHFTICLIIFNRGIEIGYKGVVVFILKYDIYISMLVKECGF